MKKIALTFVVILLLMAGIGAGDYLVRHLSLIPNKNDPSVDETFTVSANINTGTNEVSGVELHLTFDESKLEATGATNSSFFVAPQSIGPSIDNNNGTLTYTVYLEPGSTKRQGQGTVAVFTFRTKSAGNTTIALSSETNVAGNEGSTTPEASDDNLLTGSTPAVLTILSVEQPTPTTAPQITNTPTPVSGGGTATRTPTPTTVGSVSAASLTPTPSSGSLTDVTITTVPDELPDSGVSIPTTLGFGLGILVLIGSLFLAL
jgi:hypothetical protein